MPIANHYRCGRHLGRWIVFLSVLLLSAAFPCGRALGQPDPEGAAASESYLVDSIDMGLQKQRSKIWAILRAATFRPGEQAVFDKFYGDYALARWTEPKNRHLLEGYRKDLGNDLMKRAKRGEVHDHLNELVLKTFTTTAKENYHPASRVNAALMIGELNEVEAARAMDRPVPLPAALQTLFELVQEVKQLDAVKVAALVGIVRHAKLGIADADLRDKIQTEMVDLVTSQTGPGPAADGHAWMRVQAARVLGAIGSPGNASATADALAAMVADEQLRLAARCVAARALGQLDYGGTPWAKAEETVVVMRQLALDACDAEKDGVSRRRLRYHLTTISDGLDGDPESSAKTGIGPLVGADRQQFLAALKASLDALQSIADDKSINDLDLADRVDQEAEKIKGLKP